MFSCYKLVTENTASGRGTILNYHRVFESGATLRPDALLKDEFASKMLFLKQHFNVMSLPDLLAAAENDELPPLAVAITVDDGYKDGHSIIAPILSDLNLSGAFFITTEGIEEGLLWNDKIANAIYRTQEKEIKGFLNIAPQSISSFEEKRTVHQRIHNMCKFMSLDKRIATINSLVELLNVDISEEVFLLPNEIVEMHNAGMIIGAHTHRHPVLALESESVAREEISRSKYVLEDILKTSIDYFAYPNGKYLEDFNAHHKSILVELGFKASLSTDWGCIDSATDMMAIPRYTPWDHSPAKWGLRLCHHFRKMRKIRSKA